MNILEFFHKWQPSMVVSLMVSLTILQFQMLDVKKEVSLIRTNELKLAVMSEKVEKLQTDFTALNLRFHAKNK